MLRPVLFTHGVAGAIRLKLTRPTYKIFLSSLFFNTHVSCTVDHTSKVWLLAFVTLIEGARMHGKAEQITVVWLCQNSESIIAVEPLITCYSQCHLLY